MTRSFSQLMSLWVRAERAWSRKDAIVPYSTTSVDAIFSSTLSYSANSKHYQKYRKGGKLDAYLVTTRMKLLRS